MKHAKKRRPRKATAKFDIVFWMRRCEELITKHSTSARTRGKYKGHGSTDSVAWVQQLTSELQAFIRRSRRGKAYDENMALGSLTGLVLTVWYCNLHRAKSYDPHRPLELRRTALAQRNAHIAELFSYVNNDELMQKVWNGQVFNFPYGLCAADGTFV